MGYLAAETPDLNLADFDKCGNCVVEPENRFFQHLRSEVGLDFGIINEASQKLCDCKLFFQSLTLPGRFQGDFLMNYTKIILILLISISVISAFGCARADETSPDMAQNMLKLRGYSFTEPEFFRAVSNEDGAAVRAFMQAGINPNAKNEKGETALTYAIQNKDPKVIKVLLEKADVNMKDDLGNSPLHLAIKNDKEEIFDLLLEKGANVNAGGKSGNTENQTALYVAVLKGREDLVQKLLEKGADPNIADNQGGLPLSEAVARQDANPQIVKLLLEKGAKVNAQEPNKGTALIFAASNKAISSRTRQEIVKILLDHGADKSIKDDKGKTALDWAKQSGHEETAEMLK